MKNKIKLFEEYFWQISDNETSNKIIAHLKKEIDVNKLTRIGGDGLYVFNSYQYIISNDKNDNRNEIDPLGEEVWENDMMIVVEKIMEIGKPFFYYKVNVNDEIELKTNKGIWIYYILHNAYKNRQKNDKRKKLKDLFK